MSCFYKIYAQCCFILLVLLDISHSAVVQQILCYCEFPHCSSLDLEENLNGTCVLSPGSQCYSAIQEDEHGEPTRTYGCLPPEESSDMQCKANLSPHVLRKSIECCNFTDLCNRNLKPKLRPRFDPPPVISWEDNLVYIIFGVSVIISIIFFFVLVMFVFFRLKKKEETKMRLYASRPMFTSPTTLTDLISQSSKSGSGPPLFVQRTIARQIEPKKLIGKGRYGEVWLATWQSDKIAVKIFSTTQEKSWFRETEIYQTVLMRHSNILGFIAADIKGTGSWTQMLLITEYHERGSLYDYLQTNELDVSSLLSLVCSIAAGISHLHTEIFSTKGKPAVAHRDIKSKNILVKKNIECVIADFGLAVRYNSKSNELDMDKEDVKVGTKRYMAPEILDGTLDSLLLENNNAKIFEVLKIGDIYSLGLVLWELCRRCHGDKEDSKAEGYAFPYFDKVPNDPSYDDMYNVIVRDEIRPAIPERWKENTTLDSISKIIQECWHPKPSVRPTALRVKKSLINLQDSIERSKVGFIK